MTNQPIYEVVKFVIENAAELAKKSFGPTKYVYEHEACYRVHKSAVVSNIMELDRGLDDQLQFITNELFHRQASFNRSSQWFTIFKPSTK